MGACREAVGAQAEEFQMVSLDMVPALGGDELFKGVQVAVGHLARAAALAANHVVHMPFGAGEITMPAVGIVYEAQKAHLLKRGDHPVDSCLAYAHFLKLLTGLRQGVATVGCGEKAPYGLSLRGEPQPRFVQAGAEFLQAVDGKAVHK